MFDTSQPTEAVAASQMEDAFAAARMAEAALLATAAAASANASLRFYGRAILFSFEANADERITRDEANKARDIALITRATDSIGCCAAAA